MASDTLQVICSPRCSNCSQAWQIPCKPKPTLSCLHCHLAGALWVLHSLVPPISRQLFLQMTSGPAVQLIRLASRHLPRPQTEQSQACLQRLPSHYCFHSQARQHLTMR